MQLFHICPAIPSFTHWETRSLLQNPVFSTWFFHPSIPPVVFYTNFSHVSSPRLSTLWFHFFSYTLTFSFSHAICCSIEHSEKLRICMNAHVRDISLAACRERFLVPIVSLSGWKHATYVWETLFFVLAESIAMEFIDECTYMNLSSKT
jgi:hypothetical protein